MATVARLKGRAMSNNLQTDRVTGMTSGKELVIDAALEAMDAAITEQEEIDFTGGIDIVLTDVQWLQNFLLNITNAGTSGLDLTVPAVKKVMVVRHKSGANAVNLKRGSTNQSLSPGGSYIVITDGTANGLIAFQITEAQPYYSTLITISADEDLSQTDHAGKFLEVDDASDVTLTVLDDTDGSWTQNEEIEGYQAGVGQVIVAGDSGVSVFPPPGLDTKTLGQYAPFALKRVGANIWIMSGALAAL